MSSEELLPPEVRSQIPYAQELIKKFKDKTSFVHPNTTAVYVAAKLANLDSIAIYKGHMEDETDQKNLKIYLSQCARVWQFIKDEIIPNID